MKAENYLSQIKILTLKIKNKKIELEELRSLCESTSCATDSERVQTSRNLEGFQKHIPKIVEEEQEIQKEIIRLIDTRKEVISTIEEVLSGDPDLYDVIHMYYVQGYKWIDIAEMKHYSYQNINLLKNKALVKIQKRLDTI